MRYESDLIGVIGRLDSCCWTLAQSTGKFGLMDEYDMDPKLRLLALALANMIDFGVPEEPDWFLINLEDSIVYDLRTFEDPGRSVLTYLAVPVCYEERWRDDGMGAAFAQAILDRYHRDGTNLFQIPSFAKQSQYVASLGTKTSGSPRPSGVCGGEEEMSDAVLVEEAAEED